METVLLVFLKEPSQVLEHPYRAFISGAWVVIRTRTAGSSCNVDIGGAVGHGSCICFARVWEIADVGMERKKVFKASRDEEDFEVTVLKTEEGKSTTKGLMVRKETLRKGF